MADNLNIDDQEARNNVRYLNEQLLKSQNLYEIKQKQLKLEKDININAQLSEKLSDKQQNNADKYFEATTKLEKLEKKLLEQQKRGQAAAAKNTKKTLETQAKKLEALAKTEGGYNAMQKIAYDKRLRNLTAEQQLINDINKKRAEGNKLGSIGVKIADLFKSKEEKQRQIQKQIDLARSAVGGGANRPSNTGTEAGGTDVQASLSSRVGAALLAGVKSLSAPLIAIKDLAKDALVAPFAEAANLLSGDSLGLGGGKVKATGVSSILGGLEKIASTIPFIGFLLGPITSAFKGIVEAVLGIDQANFRVARSMNISVEQAAAMRKQFGIIANDSGNIVMNNTRMLQSYVEIGSQLGINAQLSNDIYQNDVKLRDILGLEAESRKVLVDQSIVTGRNAEELTRSVIGTVGAFNQLVGTSFKWSSILSEASKLGGYLGLTLTKYPEKIYKAILATKTLGMDLKQLDTTASSFLDFESSISKEMEAQVLTGKDMNLTLAREAALNNDYATLSAEITKNVGSAAKYLNMNRIQQDAIAESVGLTRDSLGDILKKQEIYTRAGVTDQKGLVARLELLQQQKKTQDEISATLGKDGYALATQVSTAERLTEMMEKIKIAIVDFVKDSGLLDFLTDPKKINNFIKTVTDNLAGVVNFIGRIIADLIQGIGSLPFKDKQKWEGYAAQIRGGTGEFSGTIRSIGENLGGAVSKSVNGTVEQGVKQEATQKTSKAVLVDKKATASNEPMTANLYLDGLQITSAVFNRAGESYQVIST